MSYPESFKRPITLGEALRICDANSIPTSRTETLPLISASGRILADDIKAAVDVPPFTRSAMDGYAVRASDTGSATKSSPVILKIRSKVFAGGIPKIPIEKGECAAIATGGMLPKGADSIAMIEFTSFDKSNKNSVSISQQVEKGEHVIFPGSDIRKGTTIAKKGEFLFPGKIGSISAIGKKAVRVYGKPRIIVMPTGNEVVRPGSNLRPGQIYDVNTFTLCSTIASFGGNASIDKIVKDDIRSITKALLSHRNDDIVVLSGGSSVGEKDLLSSVIDEIGKVLFHGVAIKPGKPTLLGRVGHAIVIGMPGHPTSCLSNAYLFLEPMIRKIGRIPISRNRDMKLKLSQDVSLPKGRELVLHVRVKGDLAIPTFKESSAITSIANADGFAIIPPKGKLAKKGSSVLVRLY